MVVKSEVKKPSIITSPQFFCETEGKGHRLSNIEEILYDKNGDKIITRLLPWQLECILNLSGKLFSTIIAATGAGKSLAIKIIATHDVINIGNKVLIVVPQKCIQNEFELPSIIECLPDGYLKTGQKTIRWAVRKIGENSKIENIKKWIKSKPTGDIREDVRVITHQALAKMFGELSNDEKEHLKGISLFVDEMHHVYNCGKYANEIGKVQQYYLENKIRFTSATATPYRGDRGFIVPEVYRDEFSIFNLSYVRHFEENCNGLCFSYDFLLHGGTYIDLLHDFYKIYCIRKDLILIPTPGHREAEVTKKQCPNGKSDQFKAILKILSDGGSKPKEDQNGVWIFEKDGKTIRVLDLVDDSPAIRKQRLNYFSKNNENIDVVVGIYVPKEGFDWPAANRVLIMGYRGSKIEVSQMTGRVFRPHPSKEGGKTVVQIFQCFSNLDALETLENKEALRYSLNEYTKSNYASMVGELKFNPIAIKIHYKRPNSEKKTEEDEIEIYEEVNAYDYLESKIGHEILDLFIQDVIEKMAICHSKNGDRTEEQMVQDKKAMIVDTILKYNISKISNIDYEFVDSVFEVVEKISGKRTNYLLKRIDEITKGDNTRDVHIDLIKEAGPYGFLVDLIVTYTNGKCECSDLKEFRRVMQAGIKDFCDGDKDRFFHLYDNSFKVNGNRHPQVDSDDPLEAFLARQREQSMSLLREKKKELQNV